ncbi:hypothetical protein STEG23_008316 [Scotinomys teguina]
MKKRRCRRKVDAPYYRYPIQLYQEKRDFGITAAIVTAVALAASAAAIVGFCRVRGMQVEQNSPVLSLHEGTGSTLRCSFSETMTTVQWFRQNPGGSLISLFFMDPGTKENGKLKSTFDSKERYSSLHIRDAQLGDSGTYLCAAEDAQCSQQACSLAPNGSWVCSYSPATWRLCRRLCTAV